MQSGGRLNPEPAKSLRPPKAHIRMPRSASCSLPEIRSVPEPIPPRPQTRSHSARATCTYGCALPRMLQILPHPLRLEFRAGDVVIASAHASGESEPGNQRPRDS